MRCWSRLGTSEGPAANERGASQRMMVLSTATRGGKINKENHAVQRRRSGQSGPLKLCGGRDIALLPLGTRAA